MKTEMINKNRIITKANRNLFQDQIISIKVLSQKKQRSESEVLREIIDFYLKEKGLEKGGITLQ